ncbi:M23 family metallopeptidase [Acidobacteriota bacterium]
MARKFFEIIMVPSTSAQFIRYRISYKAILWLLVGFSILLVLIGLLLARYINIQRQKAVIAESKEASFHLKQENERLRDETDVLSNKVRGFETTVDEFKRIFGVKSEGATGDREAGPGMNLTETRESEQYNAFLYMAKLRDEPDRTLQVIHQSPSEIEPLGVIMTNTPSLRPVKHGFLSSGYGYRIDPFTGQSVHHKAIDISAWYWEEIMAPADGLVVRTGYTAQTGRYVEISHGFGYTTSFQHLQKYTVFPGDRVRRWDVIGYVGNTGRSTGPHLHYEVRFSGIPMDPIQFVADPFY